MPRAWTAKDERQYEHIKESAEERGQSVEVAEEVAARTVNKRRQKEGRTQNRTPQGTGNPNERLAERTVQELRNRARELKVAGRSRMTKAELVSALQRRGGTR